MSLYNEAFVFKREIENIARAVCQAETRSCLRCEKARVVTAPYTDNSGRQVCDIVRIGDTTTLTLPYSSKMANMSVGNLVLVLIVYGNWKNAIVWETLDFKEIGGPV